MGPPKRLRFEPGSFGVQNPGMFATSDEMVRRMWPEVFTLRSRVFAWLLARVRLYGGLDRLREQLWLGSIQAAVVVSMKPGRVAAYSDMLDCVAMLGYSTALLEREGLKKGSKLLTVNYYDARRKHADLHFGPGQCSNWKGFYPQIADFLSPDEERLAERKAALPRHFWERTWQLGLEYFRKYPDVRRSGSPGAIPPWE